MSRQDLPEQLRPLEQNIADVESLEDPNPVLIAQVQVGDDSGRLRIADVASIEVRQHIQDAHDWEHMSVELGGRQPESQQLIVKLFWKYPGLIKHGSATNLSPNGGLDRGVDRGLTEGIRRRGTFHLCRGGFLILNVGHV
jgi:hypothetical protein